MLTEKREVIKHSAAIQIQNNITLLQRRAWNVLLANAYDELPSEETSRIRVRDLMRVLEFDSKNEDYLKESLEAIVGCKVKWNVLDKDNKWEWGVTTLLSHVIIKNGLCTYSYSPPLREKLYNPNMYARISLSLQNKFSSKHAQALWELCVDYLDESKNYGETPFVSLEKYRELMGISGDSYTYFKKLNTRVIKEPVEEINKVTDFRVQVEYRRERRKVVAVKFRVRRVLQIPEQSTRQETLFPDLDDMPIVIKELKEAGLAHHDAWEVWQQGFDYVDAGKRPNGVEFEAYVREKIHLLKSQETGKVKNQTGFLLAAIKQNYANPGFATSQKAKAASQKVQADVIRDKELRKLHEEKEEAEREKQETIGGICARMIDDTPELVDPIMHMILEADRGYRIVYDSSSSPLDNYREHVLLRMRVNTELVQQYPERFAAVCADYAKQLADIEQKMSALEEGG